MPINVLEYLEYTAVRLPEKPAFIGEGEQLTFAEVYARARSVGTFLREKGLYKEPVAIFMEKRPATIAAFFGTVYAGCFYVPLDAEMPAFRIQLILETIKPRVLICEEKTREVLTAMGYSEKAFLYAEAAYVPANGALLEDVRETAIDTDPVYVVFTSGSTGIPKGVVASHRSVIDYIENLSQVLRFNEDTVFGNQVPLYVDACLKEIYPTVKLGAATYLIPKQLFMFPVKLVAYLNARQINTVCWVVSALTIISGFNTLDKIIPETLTTIAFGSEVFPVKQFNRWRKALPNTRFVHLYGPTEATGMSAYYEADRFFNEDEVIPIGQPFKNTGILLLNDDGNMPPTGEPGEICIRGAGLSLGYYGDPVKTSEVFVQNPLSPFPDVIYKTGDIGSYNEKGELLFLTRRDQQIKHMGHRVELAEIEWAVLRCEGVRMACVLHQKETSRIRLFYEGTVEVGELTAYCRNTLPRYMVPYQCVKMERLPLTPNGKIDRVGLGLNN